MTSRTHFWLLVAILVALLLVLLSLQGWQWAPGGDVL